MILGLGTVSCQNESTKIDYKIIKIIYLPRVNKYNIFSHNAAACSDKGLPLKMLALHQTLW